MRPSTRGLALLFVGVMCVAGFQSVSACGGMDDSGADVDFFRDSEGDLHKVWREHVNGTFQLFYASKDSGGQPHGGHGGGWSPSIQVTNSDDDTEYPQISIDSVTENCYVTWYVEERTGHHHGHDSPDGAFWYCGSIDFENWTSGQYGADANLGRGNPVVDMYAESGIITVTWKHDHSAMIEADLDGDFLPDMTDPDPFSYNMNGDEGFDADVVAVNGPAGVSVAVDYSGDSTISPSIVQTVPSSYLTGSIGLYVDIEVSTSENFSANIKFNYDPLTLPSGVTEKYLRVYWYSDDGWRILYNYSQGENTGLDVQFGYVWGSTTHFSTFTIADSSQVDSDSDVLTDVVEINGDDRPDEQIDEFFRDGYPEDERTLWFDGSGTKEVIFKVPENTNGLYRASSSTFDLTGHLNSIGAAKVETPDTSRFLPQYGPTINGDNIVWFDTRNGNMDVFLYNLDTTEMVQVSSSPEWDGVAIISGDYIAYRSGATYGNAMICQISTGVTEQLFSNAYISDMYGQKITWMDGLGYLHLYDIVDRTETTLVDHYTGIARIHENRIGYRDNTLGGIWIYDISTGEKTRITDVALDPFLLDLDSDYVVYQDLATYELYGYMIAKGETVKLTATPAYLENNPVIDGGVAVWTDYRNDEGDIYAYDFETGTEIPVCVAPNMQNAPSIHNGRIVWQDGGPTNSIPKIYMSTVGTPYLSISIDDMKVEDIVFDVAAKTTDNFAPQLNDYLHDHVDSDDGTVDGYIEVPLTFQTTSSGRVDISNLKVDLYVPRTDPVDSDSDDDDLNDGEEQIDLCTDPTVKDTDSDGIDDGDEKEYWESNDDGLFLDFDDDGWSNNLLDIDADGDGLIDGDEINIHNSLPGDEDSDIDGLLDGDEVAHGTEINCADPDIDGLLDGDEVNIYFTDPSVSDSDADGLDDGLERDYWMSLSLPEIDSPALYNYDKDGILSNLMDSDADGDGLNDGDELSVYGTIPYLPDSDDDGLADGVEIGLGLQAMDPDSDGDSLSDGDEIFVYGTDPNDSDTDHDGIFDNNEATPGTDADGDGLIDTAETYVTHTSPYDRDTDNDGLGDGYEFGTSNTLPGKADSDGDGLVDGWIDANLNGAYDAGEYNGELGDPATMSGDLGAGGSLLLGSYLTDPNNPSSDTDGLIDGWGDANENGRYESGETMGEVGDALNGYAGGYRTRPDRADTDVDGLNDNKEVLIYFAGMLAGDIDGDGVKNGPLDPDSDDDSLKDGAEVDAIYQCRYIAKTGVSIPLSPNVRPISLQTPAAVGVFTSASVVVGVSDATMSYDIKLQGVCMGIDMGTKALTIGETDITSMFPSEKISMGCTWRLTISSLGATTGTLSNFRVIIYQSPNPASKFTDGDTYTDSEEYSTTRTSPVMSDSDNDGVIDNIELAYRSPTKTFISSDEGSKLTVQASTPTTFTKTISTITAYGRVFSSILWLKCSLACNAQYTLKCYYYGSPTLLMSKVIGTFNNPDTQIDLLNAGFEEQWFRWHPANRFDLVIDVPSTTAQTATLTYFRVSLITMPDPTDKNSDQWGLYDGQELLDGTDPTNPLDDEIDTDGDGLSDPLENEYFSVGDIDWDGHSNGMWDPDTDGDGVGDGDELYPSSDNTRSGTYSSFSATDPADEDTDDDELHDGEEITYFTNPNSKHSDKDGLKDGYEINVVGTQPLDVDSDNDSLLDGWNDTNVNGFYETGEGWGEIGDITKGGLGGYGTDVGLNDTDDDDIDDGPESWFWLSRSYSEQQIKDDELISDSKYSDSDSWSDGKEILKYYTEPSDDDTDNDTAPDDRDLDPLVDLEVTVSITEILALDPIDPDDSYAGDFFVKIFIDQVMYGQWSDDDTDNTPDWTNADGITEWDQDSHKTPDEIGDKLTNTSSGLSDWDTDELVEIIILLYDDDQGHSDDDFCDIGVAPSDSWNYITIYYSLKNGSWYGDDDLGDANGYGYVSGDEDGTTWTDDDDCGVWFDIWQNESDNDRIVFWEETQYLNMNPLIADNQTSNCSLGDIDQDGLPNWYERKYCNSSLPNITWMRPSGSHGTNGDQDSDGLSNLEEYSLKSQNSNPTHPDLFVEIDWFTSFTPNMDALDWIIRYYTTFSLLNFSGIHLELQLDEEIPLSESSDNDGNTDYTIRCNVESKYHQMNTTHVYCCIGKLFNSDEDKGGATDENYGIFIPKYAIEKGFDHYYSWRQSFSHELGHSIGIGQLDDAQFNVYPELETYCYNTNCFMSAQNVEYYTNVDRYCGLCIDNCFASDGFYDKSLLYNTYMTRLWFKCSVDGEHNRYMYW